MALSKQSKVQLSKIQDYVDTFGTAAGQRVLGDMMSAHGMLSPHPIDPHKMMIREGERGVVLRILTLLKTDMKQLRERMEAHDRSIST